MSFWVSNSGEANCTLQVLFVSKILALVFQCGCFLASLGILARLSASCHVTTCFFVDVVDFSLMTTLFVLFH